MKLPTPEPGLVIGYPTMLKKYLGLDDHRSWVVVTETNDFLWPGPDLRSIPGRTPSRIDYGILPARFFAHVRDRILQEHRRRKLTIVRRSE